MLFHLAGLFVVGFFSWGVVVAFVWGLLVVLQGLVGFCFGF